MVRCPRPAALVGLALLAIAPAGGQVKKSDPLNDLLDGSGGTTFRLVTAEEKPRPLADVVYWRTHHGVVAASVAPVRFRLGDQDIIAPVPKPDATDTKDALTYPTAGKAKVKAGKYTLFPGNVPIEFRGTDPVSTHPAIRIADGEVQIRCAPVRLEVVDDRGHPVPAPMRLVTEKGSLMREETRFSVLTLWLPVGCEYQTTLGKVALTAEGKVKGSDLGIDVTATPDGLRQTVQRLPGGSVIVETITVSVPRPGGKMAQFAVYAPAVARPGEPLRLAVSRRAYQAATDQPFDPAALAVRFDGSGADAKVLPESPPIPAVRDRADAALHTTADDIGWVLVAGPSGASGPTDFIVRPKGGSPTRGTVLVAETSGPAVVPFRWRSAFTDAERATFMLLLPPGHPAGEARVRLASADNPDDAVALGTVTLPAVPAGGYDRRFFTLDTAAVPPGRHLLWAEGSGWKTGRVPVDVVRWRPTSPFFAHTMSGCTECWDTSDDGLARLRAAGLDMATAAGGHGSILNAEVPRPDPVLAARIAVEGGLPAELAVRPTANDRLLDRALRHQLRLIDLTVLRSAGIYFESLSYHHSYQPTVDRMVRRMQVFTQQTADYPSFAGTNLSWFPQLYGYAESGVPTDAHVADRNRALAAAVKAAGFTELTREEADWMAKRKPDADRAKALDLQKRGVEHWKAAQELGWAKHNAIYNSAVREVKPDAVCTLFENAGHDERKRLRAMFHDMTAQCYESYTDFGDWPQAAGFVTDWSRGQSPGQPVWLTVNWGSTPEGMAKNLFHAFARGLAGGGLPMQESVPAAEIARRGTPAKFLSQYGALTTNATPDRRVAILCRAANVVFGRAIWDTHAGYAHLTRLGYPPIDLCDEEQTAAGVPEHVKVLVLVNDRTAWEPDSRKAVETFLARGGKVVTLGECAEPFPGSLAVPGPVKHLWELKGFNAESHAALWKEFDTLRKPLAEAMAKAGVTPLAAADPDRGLALAMDAGPVRYVVVVSETKGEHADKFEPTTGLPVTIDGTGWTVRDLARQKDLPATVKDGRTEVALDLVTEPATLLAVYKSPPKGLALQVGEGPQLGGRLAVRCKVTAADESDLGPVPVRVVFAGPDGRERDELFRAAGEIVSLPLPALDRAGGWKVSVQELLTGRTATAEVDVKGAAEKPAPAAAVGDVHVPNRDHLRAFVSKPGEKVVIVEPGQGHLLPAARKLVEAMNAAGVEARLWEIKPEDFDTHPVRWYPTPVDTERLKAIDAGQLVGVRESLKPYVDPVKRVHVPERGGYAEIDPPYMVGRDCIVFAGGKLVDSLQAVTPWVGGAYAPGRRQGRLVVCFSPFMAGRHALAVVATDEAGFEKAATELVAEIKVAGTLRVPTAGTRSVPATMAAGRSGETPKFVDAAATVSAVPVPKPFGNFTPLRRIDRLLATADGKAAVVVRGKADNLAFVDAAGKVTATVGVSQKFAAHGRLDASGTFHGPEEAVTETHPGWNFPTRVGVTLRGIGPDGAVRSELPAYDGTPELPDYLGGILRGPDGETAVLARPGGLRYRLKGDPAWHRYDDTPHAGTRFGVLYPRQPVGGAFSADGRYAVVTMDSRPPFGGLGTPTPRPTATETVLLDLKTGQRVWAVRGSDPVRSAYAVHSGFAAVARDGAVTALADCDGAVHLIDKSGKVVATAQAVELPAHGTTGLGPPNGVGVAISDNGNIAAFGFRRVLLVAQGGKLTRVPVDGLASVAVTPDGGIVAVGMTDGSVKAFDQAGKELWSAKVGETGPHVAAVEGGVLAATGTGEVIRLDAAGKPVWRVNAAEAADRGKHEPKAADLVRLQPPVEYVEPDTLVLAQKDLGAKQVAAWKPTGSGTPAFGRAFSALAGPAEVAAPDAGEFIAHLVYRRPAGNKSLKVVTDGADGPTTFWLDLPTPEYRVIDLPVRGPKAKVTVSADGLAEVAELSLWAFRWPGPNLAYVRPAGLEAKTDPKPKGGGEDILEDLGGAKKEARGKLKECRVWWPNTDYDQVRGAWLPAPVDPLAVVDGKRFDRKVGPWSDKYGNFPASRGGFFTIDLGEPTKPGFVATYDRADRQSAACAALVVFTPDPADALRGGAVLAGASGSDQFWRLFPLPGTSARVLGVHAFKGPEAASGLAEVEVYGAGR